MSIFCGKSGRNAAIAAAQQAQQTQALIDQRLREAQATGTDALTQGRDSALGAIREAQPLALSAIGQGHDEALGALDTGRTSALGAIDTAEPRSLAALGTAAGAARSDLVTARDRYTPYAETGGKAFGAQADAAGLNGQEGYDRAVGAFHESPGYRYSVDQTSDAVARKASALGVLGSGNTMAEIGDRAGHMADQEWNGHVSQIGDIARTGYDATGRQAGIDQNLANLETGLGRDQSGILDANGRTRAGIFTSDGTQRANIATGAGTADAGIYEGDAGRTAGIYTGTGSSIANLGAGLAGAGASALSHEGDQIIGASNSAFKAGDTADANKWNFGLNLANLGAGLAGSYFGGGGAKKFSNLLSLGAG